MDKPTFATALAGTSSISTSDLTFPECYHSCFASQDNSLPFIKQASRRNGKPAFYLSEAEQVTLAEPLKHTLICKFSAKLPSYDLIRKHFVSLRLRGPWKLGLLDYRHAMIKLDLEHDYAFLFTKKLHRIENVMVKFLKWTADFDFRSEPPIAPIWIKFPGLKLHFFHKQLLFSLASSFGKPLKLDLPTFNLSRPSIARVLVEMDISYSYADEIWIGTQDEGYWQEVVIDSKPLYCSNCRLFGHCLENCFIVNPQLRPIRQTRDTDYELKDMQHSVLVGGDITYANITLNKQQTVELAELAPSVDQIPNTHIQNCSNPIENQPSFSLDIADSMEPAFQHPVSLEATTAIVPCTAAFVPTTAASKVTGPSLPVIHSTPAPVTLHDVISGELRISAAVHVPNSHGRQQELETLVLSKEISKQFQQGVCSVLPCQSVTVLPSPVTGSISLPLSEHQKVDHLDLSREISKQVQHEDSNLHSSTQMTEPNSCSVPHCIPVTGFATSVTGSIAIMEDSKVQENIVTDSITALVNPQAAVRHTSTAVLPSFPAELGNQVSANTSQLHKSKVCLSEDDNTDSDSYETYTSDYREDEMHLNESYREVFEEWQEEWEFQKTKKRQKGIRELKSLLKDKRFGIAALGSRRSLSGHLSG